MFKGRLNNMTVEKIMPSKGDNSETRRLIELAKKYSDPDLGFSLELIEKIKELRDEIKPNESDLEKFIDELSEEDLKRIKLKDGSNIVDFRKYSKMKEPTVKKINLAQGDFNRAVVDVKTEADKELIKKLLRMSGINVGGNE
tara:strand:- start:274 stop:699 length:426 start_codon:yes stop_codon:yes gene_type:complete